MKRLTSGQGYELRETADTVSLDIIRDDPPHPFKVTAHREVVDETVKWWLSIEPGIARFNRSVSMCISDGSGNVTVGSLAISADDLATGADTKDFKFTQVECYKEKRFATNDLTKCQYLADGESLVFAYAQNPGGGNPKLGITSMSVFNTYFAPGLGGYSATPIIGIVTGGSTIWRRMCLNIMPIAYFDGAGKVTQYCRDTLDMILPSETAYLGAWTLPGESEQEYFDRVGVGLNWGAYTYETGADGAPAGYTFESTL